MNQGIRKAAVAAIVGGIIAAGVGQVDAQAATGQRIATRDELFAHIQKAVDTETAAGPVVVGNTGGRSCAQGIAGDTAE